MQWLKKKSFLLCTLFLILSFPQLVFAGGGTYSLNISNGQTVAGSEVEIVVTVTDNTKPEPYPLVVGEEFELVAHPESSGERCETFQKKTDSAGQMKGKCYSDQVGKFAFHIKPVTRTDFSESGSWEVFFQLQAATQTPSPSVSPTPSPTASPVVSPSPSPKTTPSPAVVVVKPTPSPKVSPSLKVSPSPRALPSPTPTPMVSPAAELPSKETASTDSKKEDFKPKDWQIGLGVATTMIVITGISAGSWQFWQKRKARSRSRLGL